MIFNFGLRAGVVSAISLCLGLSFAQTAMATSSSAFGLQAKFTTKGLTTGLGPIAAVNGSAPPGYSKSTTITGFQQIVPLVAETGPVPSLFASFTSIKSHAASAGIGIDSLSAEGDVVVKGLDVSLMLNPPPPADAKTPIEPQPYLNISVKSIQSNANLNVVFPQPGYTTTSATFSGLEINGMLLDGQTIKFTGAVPNNTVLFQSPTVTITLNSQLVAGLISCTPKCTFSPVSVTGSAINVELNKATIDGKIVSGNITIGQSQAGIGGLLSTPSDFSPAK